MRRGRNFSYMERVMMLFLVGSIAGSIIANLLSAELLEQIGSFDFMMSPKTVVPEKRKELWIQLGKRRMTQLGLGCLIGMTPLAMTAYAGLALMAGCALACLVVICTLYGGWMGIWLALKAVLPQGMCYLVVGSVLAAGAEQGIQNMKRRVWLLLAVLTALGSILEILF